IGRMACQAARTTSQTSCRCRCPAVLRARFRCPTAPGATTCSRASACPRPMPHGIPRSAAKSSSSSAVLGRGSASRPIRAKSPGKVSSRPSRNWNEDDGDDAPPPWLDIKFDYAGAQLDLAMFHDYSSEFPEGYGYALLYLKDGGAGPDASPDAVKAAI